MLNEIEAVWHPLSTLLGIGISRVIWLNKHLKNFQTTNCTHTNFVSVVYLLVLPYLYQIALEIMRYYL